MSLRKKRSTTPPAAVTASDWLSQNISSLAAEITENQFSARPGLLRKYGSKGRLKCTEDAASHLHYLSEAIAVTSPAIFTRYIGWAKIMLSSRGIESGDLKHTLQGMKRVVAKQANGEHGALIGKFITLALEELPNLPESLPPFIDSREPFAPIANKYLQSLLLLNRNEAIAGVMEEVEAGLSIRDVFQHVIFVAQQEVGRLWQMNQITVVQEHYCTSSADLLIARLRRKYSDTSRDVSALALCAANEEHSMGVRLLSELLEADGWRVAYIGSKSPTADVLKHLKANPTDLVAISIGTPLSLSKAKELIQAIRSLPLRNPPRIMLGGSALNASEPTIVQALGADAYAANILDGLEMADRLVRERRHA